MAKKSDSRAKFQTNNRDEEKTTFQCERFHTFASFSMPNDRSPKSLMWYLGFVCVPVDSYSTVNIYPIGGQLKQKRKLVIKLRNEMAKCITSHSIDAFACEWSESRMRRKNVLEIHGWLYWRSRELPLKASQQYVLGQFSETLFNLASYSLSAVLSGDSLLYQSQFRINDNQCPVILT